MSFTNIIMMKLSEYAKRLGVSYRSAWRWFKEGQIKGAFQTKSGTIIVPEEKAKKQKEN